MAVECFTTMQASRVSGFSSRQLDYWAKIGMLMPSVKQSTGPGTRKFYSFDDLVKLSFIKQLRRANWSIQKIRKSIAYLEQFTTEKPEYRNNIFINDKETILALCETQEKQQILLDSLNPKGQQVMFIVLEVLRAETQKSVDRIVALTNSLQSTDTIKLA
jgi:DNA-binding transcriptional MerR regulator